MNSPDAARLDTQTDLTEHPSIPFAASMPACIDGARLESASIAHRTDDTNRQARDRKLHQKETQQAENTVATLREKEP